MKENKDLLEIYDYIERLNEQIITLTEQVRVLSLPHNKRESTVKKSVTKLVTKIKQFFIFIITI